jgi:FtsZ-binding cell division protein ZapB
MFIKSYKASLILLLTALIFVSYNQLSNADNAMQKVPLTINTKKIAVEPESQNELDIAQNKKTIKELKLELESLKKEYKDKAIDKPTFQKKKDELKAQINQLKVLNDIEGENVESQKDKDLTEDVLFNNDDENNFDDGDATTAETEIEYMRDQE